MSAQRHDHKEGEKHFWWLVSQTFSNKPLSVNSTGGQRCHDTQIEDPLLEPAKVSGTFIKYTEEAVYDMNGLPLKTSSHEQLRGNNVEFDRNRPTVTIEQNVPNQTLDIFSPMVDHVNDAPLWGLPARTIKLSNVRWNKQFYGQCSIYYTRVLEFDIMYETFDRLLLDEGTKALNGHWHNGSGEGAQFTVTTTGGAITSATLAASGSGYPKNATIGLAVLDGTGAYGGVLLAVTDGTGEVNELYSLGGTEYIYQAGIGYTNGTKSTSIGKGWVLDNIRYRRQGQILDFLQTPDYTNPSHFKTFLDRDLNPARVILDGRGVPAGGFSDQAVTPGSIFVQKYPPANFLVLGIPTVL
jgi:hypothetical protein